MKRAFFLLLFVIVTNISLNADENLSINLSGGVSSGFYFSSDLDSNDYEGNVALSNVLFTLSLKKNDVPLSFEGGVGGTSASSLVEHSSDIVPPLGIEFADFTIIPADYFNLEMGLLQPSSGYEDTYTFNNKNSTVGILASQQPFNATGIRGNFSLKGGDVFGGFYKDRLDDEEYSWETTTPTVSYEIGINGEIIGIGLSFYHYHINNIRNLTGLVIEKDLGEFYVGLNIDYWRWSNNIDKMKNKSSIGGALYFSKSFGKKLILPFRFEYINQGQSEIYIESNEISDIYSLTFTPTYSFGENIYFRYEIGYVYTNSARIVSSVETGIRF